MYLITHSLLSAWLYMQKNEYSEDPMAEFLTVLKREPTPTTDAMQNGIEFENLVTSILEEETEKDESIWYGAARQIADICRGGSLQHKASKRISVNGMDLLLYGRLDCLKQGEIIDIKFSKRYDRGKYISSTQHPVYMELIPEAEQFTYAVSNGSEVWTESYRRDETASIYPVIGDFLNWLCDMQLDEIYKQKWVSKY